MKKRKITKKSAGIRRKKTRLALGLRRTKKVHIKAKVAAKLKKRAKPKTTYVKREIIKPTEEQINNLIAKAKTRGFVMETELLHLFPEVEEYVYDYELLLERLQKNGIRIVEDTGEFLKLDMGIKKEKKALERPEPEKGKKIEIPELSSDSIQMYLKEIGKVPLLTICAS